MGGAEASPPAVFEAVRSALNGWLQPPMSCTGAVGGQHFVFETIGHPILQDLAFSGGKNSFALSGLGFCLFVWVVWLVVF